MKTSINDFEPETCKAYRECRECGASDLFYQIHKMTNGDPCTTGCTRYQGGKCPGYRNLKKYPGIKTKVKPRKTNAEIAKELNCSKRQVAKMKKEGTIPSEYK